MNRRIKKKHRIKFSMFVFHKFFPTRRKVVPITTNDTLWTSCLRLKRVHHRQLEYRYFKEEERNEYENQEETIVFAW